jgi:hypothetical protein
MKKQVVWMPLILMVMFAAAVVSSRSQAAYGVRADVPFDFVVGDKTIPAGRITAHGVSNADQGSLTIKNSTEGQLALRIGRKMSGAERTKQCKLVFHKYGDRYFLAQIWIPGYQAWEVTKSKEERSLEHDMRLVKNVKPAPVIIAAKVE